MLENLNLDILKNNLLSNYLIHNWDQWFKDNEISLQFTKTKLELIPDSNDPLDISHEDSIMVC